MSYAAQFLFGRFKGTWRENGLIDCSLAFSAELPF